MGKGSRKGSFKGTKPTIRKSRKEIRKEQRKAKKLKRSLRFQKPMPQSPTVSSVSTHKIEKRQHKDSHQSRQGAQGTADSFRDQEKLKHDKLLAKMQENRKKLLLAANEEEDHNIHKLEKLLRLNRRKSKSLPRSFKEDGLAYLLEVCDPDTISESLKVDKALQDSGSEFEDDMALAMGKGKDNEKKTKKLSKEGLSSDTDENDGSLSDFGLDADEVSDDDISEMEDQDCTNVESLDSRDESDENEGLSEDEDREGEEGSMSECGSMSNDEELPAIQDDRSPDKCFVKEKKKKKSVKFSDNLLMNNELIDDSKSDEDISTIDSSLIGDHISNNEVIKQNTQDFKNEKRSKPDDSWEDIYGRLRDKDGNVIESKAGKYIPPALRAEVQGTNDAKRRETLARLQRLMKGLINRLAENNISNICNQIEELYMKNSRNDMNETLLNLFNDALISHVLTPERLVMEHMLLLTVLHANVGTEVGAHFLQNMIKRFEEMLCETPTIENKQLDNVVLILSHLYNFKVFTASLMYEILLKIAETLDEKRIELLLVVLRSVGFSLRKDDPVALKSLILTLQEKASKCSSVSSNTRLKFMLEILMAIKNNNMSKIPSYNPEHSEHLKKLMRNLVRRGNYVTELKISLEDLLKAEERGRWWIVGSAWTGHLPGENPQVNPNIQTVKPSSDSGTIYSAQLLELARKQRMNTGIRRDIFCILMTAEDYLDAFEKLLHLNLKNQQRQEIIQVLFNCCLQEKLFNPYYAYLSQKFCDFDREYQMKFQYCIWDKLKELNKLSGSQISNMAKLLAHLFIEKGLSLSALKVLSFAEMDKPCVRLVRQILLILLLHEDHSKFHAVFQRVAISPQLHLFREGVRLFISHFVLRKSSCSSLQEEEVKLLKERANVADKTLALTNSREGF